MFKTFSYSSRCGAQVSRTLLALRCFSSRPPPHDHGKIASTGYGHDHIFIVSGSLLPERLLVFHAGTQRIVFVGCMKLTTIFLFAFSCGAIAPAYYKAPDQPVWAPIAGNYASNL